jgi:proline iminopeptidase
MKPAARVAATLLAGFLAACGGGSGAAPLPTISARPPVSEGHLDAGRGVRLGYRIVGNGPDTLIVIHGGPGFTFDYLSADFEPLAARHALVFYDQRGSGRSTLASDSAALAAELYADDLEAVRRELRLERVNLLGHSWGAAVVALYAQRYPARLGRLVIVAGMPLTMAGLEQSFGTMQAARDTAEIARMDAAMAARRADPTNHAACRAYYALWFRPFFADPASAGRSRGDICAGSPESMRNKMASVDRYVFASLGRYDWRPMMRSVRAPTLIVHGTEDPLLLEFAREWAATLPDSRILVLDRIGHFPYVEAPDRFFPAVDRFLKGAWPAGAVAVGAP